VWRGVGGLGAFAQASLTEALSHAMIGGVGIILLRMDVPNLRAAFVRATLAFSFLAARGQIDTGLLWLDLVIGVLLVVPILGVIVRYGFVAGTAGFFVHFVTKDLPTSLDPSRFFFGAGVAVAVVIVLVAVTGFVLARGREPVFGGMIRAD
jgi:hypothetical protein